MSTPIAFYSPSRRVENLVFCSGQLGLANGELVEGVAAQTDQAMSNITTVLSTHGATLDDVVKTTIFLADIDDYAMVDERYSAAFGEGEPPARSAVAVAGLPRGARVEIEAIAHLAG